MTSTTVFITTDLNLLTMNKIFTILLAVMLSLPVFAGGHGNRKKWMDDMKRTKHEFLAKELQLSKTQCRDFFDVYDKMMEERFAVEKKMREAEMTVINKGANASEREINAVIDEQYSLDIKLNKIDRKYLPWLREILTPSQLMKLKHAERKFQRHLMEKKGKQPPRPQSPHQKK